MSYTSTKHGRFAYRTCEYMHTACKQIGVKMRIPRGSPFPEQQTGSTVPAGASARASIGGPEIVVPTGRLPAGRTVTRLCFRFTCPGINIRNMSSCRTVTKQKTSHICLHTPKPTCTRPAEQENLTPYPAAIISTDRTYKGKAGPILRSLREGNLTL